MRRVLIALVAIAACKGGATQSEDRPPVGSATAKVEPKQQSSGSGSGSADKPKPDIELLHATKAKVAVSSVVANNSIFPTDLVDGKLDTAWNSRTGDLKTAWIEFRVPREAHVSKIRLTAGFATFHGADDWFKMNYRIKAVHVKRLGVDGDFGVQPLDPENRGMQDIPIDGPGGDFKIEIANVTPGTKKNWRELCVSELQVWGTPPAGATPRREAPTVAIGGLDAEPPPDLDIDLAPLPAFASIDEFCASYLSRPPEKFAGCLAFERETCRDAAPATCGEAPKSEPLAPIPEELAPLPASWTSAKYFYTTAAHSTVKICDLAFDAGHEVFILEGFADAGCGAPQPVPEGGGHTRHEVQLHAGMLAFTTTTAGVSALWNNPQDEKEQLWLCGGDKPSCSAAVDIGDILITQTSGGEPGADGMSIDVKSWSLDWKLDGKQLVLSHLTGDLDENTHAQLGAHRVVSN